MNKVLNILGWIIFVLSIVSYFADEIPVEACYLALASLFLISAPRTVDQ